MFKEDYFWRERTYTLAGPNSRTTSMNIGSTRYHITNKKK